MKCSVLLPAFFLLLAIPVKAAFAGPNIPAADSSAADIADTLKSSLTLLPAVFYMPETKLGFGIYPNYIFRFSPGSKPSNLSFLAYYTVKKQVSVSFDPRLYLKDNNYVLSGTIFYEKWPDEFFGFGTGVSKENKEDYTTRNTGFYTEVQRKVFKELYAGISYELSYTRFLEMEENGALASGKITGAENGTLGGAGFTLSWEGMDNIFFPGRGEYFALESSFHGRGLGGDYTFQRLILDFRKYHSWKSNNVLAFQLYGRSVDGDVPFRSCSQIGQIVRGYLPALYIEKKLAALQLEYRRVPLWRRFGFALFAGAGSVARTIPDFKSSKFKFAAGLGIRYILVESEKFNIRLDYGFSHRSAELYLDVGEAF